jgi:hypothetical protein
MRLDRTVFQKHTGSKNGLFSENNVIPRWMSETLFRKCRMKPAEGQWLDSGFLARIRLNRTGPVLRQQRTSVAVFSENSPS